MLEDHLRRRLRGDIEGDLAANFAAGVVVLSKDGVHHGHDGVRHTAALLAELLPDASFSYDLLRAEGDYALLSWSAEAANGARTRFGADSFVVGDGFIIAQTIHYEVESPSQA